MVKQYLATYKDAKGKTQTLEVLAYDAHRATMGAAELIPASATLIRVVHNPDWN
jgi:hypothetical protein